MAAPRERRTLEQATKILPIAAAVVAALLVLLVRGLVAHEWRWLNLGEDLIKNLFIGGLLALAVLWLEQRQRESELRLAAEAARERQQQQVMRIRELAQLAASGWSRLNGGAVRPTADATTTERVVADIGRSVEELRKSADALDEMHDRKQEDPNLLFDLFTLPFLLQAYLSEGGRERRFAYLDLLLRELSGVEAAEEGSITTAVREFRASVPAAVAWRTHTDTTVIERLLVEKVVDGVSLGAADVEDHDLRDVMRLDAAVVAREPLYLLQAYAAVHGSNVTTPEEARRRLGPVNRCVGALRNEMRAVATALERLGRLIEVAMGVAGPPP